jgi:hypothetical protein
MWSFMEGIVGPPDLLGYRDDLRRRPEYWLRPFPARAVVAVD